MTDAQRATIDAVLALSADGLPPTVNALMAALGVGHTATYKRILSCRRHGWIAWTPRAGRTWRVTAFGGAVPVRAIPRMRP